MRTSRRSSRTSSRRRPTQLAPCPFGAGDGQRLRPGAQLEERHAFGVRESLEVLAALELDGAACARERRPAVGPQRAHLEVDRHEGRRDLGRHRVGDVDIDEIARRELVGAADGQTHEQAHRDQRGSS